MFQTKAVSLKIALFIAVLTSARLASASSITWGPATPVSGNSDISTVGTYVDAINFGPSNITDDNGDVFHHVLTTGLASENSLATDPITVSIDNIQYPAGSPGTGNTNYDNILSYLGYDNGRGSTESSTVKLNGLNPGRSYEVEFWTNQPINRNSNSAVISSGPTLSDSPGEFAIGTFTADGTGSESFTFTSPGNPIVNAIMLRDITTPEPSSIVALCGLGAMGLFLFARRRRKS